MTFLETCAMIQGYFFGFLLVVAPVIGAIAGAMLVLAQMLRWILNSIEGDFNGVKFSLLLAPLLFFGCASSPKEAPKLPDVKLNPVVLTGWSSLTPTNSPICK